MAIKNNLIGGIDYITPTARIKPTDLNDTNNAIINAMLLPRFASNTATDVQTFTANGTWTKPAGAKLVYVRLWGGGGSGSFGSASGSSSFGYSGGAGGGYGDIWFNAEDLTSTVSITVGSGGAPVSGGNGNSGGASSFGSYATVGGGQFGRSWSFGSPFPVSVGGSTINSVTTLTGTNSTAGNGLTSGLFSGSTLLTTGSNSIYGGAGAGGFSGTSSTSFVSSGGTSIYGGNGGDGGNIPTDGQIPAGGGGAAMSNGVSAPTESGAGARGQVEVYTF